jgi:hypothetical protein
VLHSIEKPRDIQYKDYAYDSVSPDDIQDFHLMNPHPFAFHEIREL